MTSLLHPATVLFLLLTVVTGLLYPALVTGIGQLLFPRQAAGSLISQGDATVGSALIGQSFSGNRYFWSRPSATGPMANHAAASSGSNLGPSNPALVEAVNGRVQALRAAHPDQTGPIPADLVTASASGLDPHLSPAAAYFQVGRVAKARGLAPEVVAQLVRKSVKGPDWGLFGDPTVNVLQLNLALDALSAAAQGR